MRPRAALLFALAVLAAALWGAPAGLGATLVLEMDETGTAFTDTSGQAHAITNVGGVGHQTADLAPFVGNVASGDFSTQAGYLAVGDSADWSFGTGAFTIEAWFKPTGDQIYSSLVSSAQTNPDVYSWNLGYSNVTNALAFWEYPTLYNGVVNTDPGLNVTVAPGAWHHVAVVRNGTGIYLFLDDLVNPVDSLTISAGLAFDSAGVGLAIGRRYVNGPNTQLNFGGYLDRVIVDKGHALYGPGAELPAPEPATLALAGVGLAALAVRRRGR